jgi:prepilin-type N-terminal cleavage/methylation domain-containing protein
MNFRFWNLNSNLKPFRNQESPSRYCTGLPSQGSETTEAISQQIENKEIATLSMFARKDPKRITKQFPRGDGWRGSRGFTLIEIIIVIVILSIIGVMTIKFLADSLRIYTMTVNQKTLFDEGKLALRRMCRDIRDAKSITGTTASSITFVRTNQTAYDSGLPGDTTGETITFRRNAGANTLEKVKTSPAATATMASNVTAFNVMYTNDIQLQLTLSMTSGENVTLQTTVYPKNLDKDLTNTYKNFFQHWEEVYQ